jgi:Kef-type K+ transport system membrane component KefB
VTEESNAGQNGQAPGQEPQRPPYAFYVAVVAIVAPCLVYFLSMWVFGDLFQDAATSLGSLFTLIGTVAGAYFGIKVSNDTSARSQGAIERAHGRAEEANERAQQAHDTAQQALAELDPNVARRIVRGGSGDATR